MSAATKREIKKLLLAVGATILVAYVCVALTGHLFWCYYREQWGISAWVLHSPPHGRNHTDKLAIVCAWATYIGIALGLVANALIGRKVFPGPATRAERDPEL